MMKEIDIEQGLTTKEVEERITKNLVNYKVDGNTKSIKDIYRENILTLFNIINIILAIAVIAVGSFKNLAFMSIIILNTAISIFQEIRSKKTLDKLKVVAISKAKVIRNSKEESLDIYQLVIDDIIKVEIGNQIVVDSLIRDGEVEVNESFITGESHTVFKKSGEELLSGSFIVSGKATCQVKHIGLDNYTAKISNAKYIKPISSEIMRSLNKIVSTISFLIIPVGILLFARQMYIENNTITNAVVNTVAALIGMIPEGLVLLTSTVLAVSVIRLSQRKVLVQDLYCIETLARVDTICLDKTGTITDASLKVVKDIPLSKMNYQEIIQNINGYLDENNPTALALKEKYGQAVTFKEVEKMPFSSSKKYSGIKVGNKSYLIGAPEFILGDDFNSIKDDILQYTKDYRVVLLALKTNKNIDKLAYILIEDSIRKEAPATLEYFRKQGVDLKIISGDNPDTVLNIAKRAGLDSTAKAIDASTLKSDQDILQAIQEYSVFGRVTPEQKRKFVLALQSLHHTVAMTGDGVNDVLALKEADCSVAMASGSDATKNVSQLVLLDSNFASMPHIVEEGRQTINNIEKSASLFLVKTVYATLLAIIFIFIKMPYPFIPIQLTLTSVVTIGIPSFILALEPNNDQITGQFLPNVLKVAIPPAVTIVLNILVIYIASTICHLTTGETSTLSVIITGYTSFLLLYKVCQPFNKIRLPLFITMLVGFIAILIIFKSTFALTSFHLNMIIIVIICMAFSYYLYGLSQKCLKVLMGYLHKIS